MEQRDATVKNNTFGEKLKPLKKKIALMVLGMILYLPVSKKKLHQQWLEEKTVSYGFSEDGNMVIVEVIDHAGNVYLHKEFEKEQYDNSIYDTWDARAWLERFGVKHEMEEEQNEIKM